MSSYFGGYVLIPIDQEARLSELAVTISQQFPLYQYAVPPLPDDEVVSSLIQKIDDVRQGIQNFLLGGVPALITFDTPVGPYHSVRVAVDDALFNRRARTWNPARLETFPTAWAQACETVRAKFGYFSVFEPMAYEEYLLDVVIPRLEGNELYPLPGSKHAPYWLTYQGPELVARWSDRPAIEARIESEVRVTLMPSGAVFLLDESERPVYTRY